MKVEELPNEQGVYKINFPNGKMYIGISNKIKTRIRQHINKTYEHPELPISRAIDKYGIQDVDILELLPDTSRDILREREKFWIKQYDAINKGYNVSEGGDGWNNSQAAFTKETLFELYDKLRNTNLTYEELASYYKVTGDTIGKINDGTRYTQKEITYPIRGKRVFTTGLDNKRSTFYHREDELLKIINDLENTDIPLSQLSKIYGVCKSNLSLINQGKKYPLEGKNYPLRKTFSKGGQNKRIFSEEELLQMRKELLEKQFSMGEIALHFKCNRALISQVNNGTRQHQANWEYPIRKTIK